MHYLGLFQEGDTVKLALLRNKRGKVSIELLRTGRPATKLEYVKPLYMLEERFRKKDPVVISALFNHEVFVRSWKAKLPRFLLRATLKKILSFEVEQLMPFSAEQVIAAALIDKNREDNSVIATTDELLKDHLDKLKNLSVDPEVISCEQIGIMRFMQWIKPSLSSYFMVHIGLHHITFLIVTNSIVRFSISISTGVSHLLAALRQDKRELSLVESREFCKKVELTRVSRSHFPHLAEQCKLLEQELDRVISFTEKEHAYISKLPLIFSGQCANYFKMEKFVAKGMHFEAEAIETVTTDEKLVRFAVPIGICIDQIKGDSINFRTEKWICFKVIKKRLLQLYSYLGFSLLLFATTVTAVIALNQKELKKLNALFSSYTTQKDLSFSKLKEEADLLDTKIKKPISKQEQHLPVKVVEFLGWLTRTQEKADPKMPLLLTSFNYSLKPASAVDIEITFTTDSAVAAKKLYKELEQKWGDKKMRVTHKKNSYRAEIHLK